MMLYQCHPRARVSLKPDVSPAGDAVKEPKQELAVNGAAEPLEPADGLDDAERARLKAEKKAAKKEKKVCSYGHAWLMCSVQSTACQFLPPQTPHPTGL